MTTIPGHLHHPAPFLTGQPRRLINRLRWPMALVIRASSISVRQRKAHLPRLGMDGSPGGLLLDGGQGRRLQWATRMTLIPGVDDHRHKPISPNWTRGSSLAVSIRKSEITDPSLRRLWLLTLCRATLVLVTSGTISACLGKRTV